MTMPENAPAEDATPEVEPPETEDENTDADDEGLDPKIQARIDKANREAKNLRDRLKAAESKASELDKIKQGEMSEKDRLAKEKSELQAQIDELTVSNIRREAALAAKLPADFVEFITATTEDDAAEQAKRLAKHLAPATKPDLKQGARGTSNAGTTESRDDALRRMAGRL